MAFDTIPTWSTTAGSNTEIDGISLAENVMVPSAVNNAFREMMAQVAEFTRRGTDLASAATLNLDSIDTMFLDITGTTTVTAVTLTDGHSRRARATGAFTLTASATLVVNGSTSTNYTTTAGDLLFFEGYGSSTVRVWALPGGASTTYATNAQQLAGTSAVVTSTPDSVAALWEAGADNTDGATITMGDGGYFNLITSTTAITAFAFTTDKAGRTARVRFNTARTITHNATSLILPGGANITTAAGDIAQIRSLGSGNFVMEWFTRAAVAPVGQVVAWATFQGDGTVTILASGNVSSITDNGAGDYTFNFSTAIADANYALFGMTLSAGINANAQGIVNIASSANDPGAASTKTTTACRVLVANASTGTLTDKRVVCVVFIR